MDWLMNDLRFAARLLWKNKGFTASAIATLAVCIGVNAAIFSVVHSVVLKPLPFQESDRVMLMYNSYPGAGVERAATGVPDYYDRLKGAPAFEEQALFNGPDLTIGSAGSVQQVRGMGVTPSFFRVLKAKPLFGRLFTDEEGEVGQERKAVLSYGLWQELYGGDKSVVGQDIRIFGNPYTIVGVLPRGFVFLDPQVRLYRPLAFTAQQKADDARHSNNWEMIGRLKPGATLKEAQAQIDAINAANMERLPQWKEILTNARFSARVVSLQDDVVRPIRKTLYLLWGGAAFVLMIGIINIANLALARGSVRLREIATRITLGAGRWRIARQLLIESLLMTAGGAAAGLVLGYLGLGALRLLHLERIPRGAEVTLDATVVLYVLGLSLLAAVAIGVIPLAQGLRVNLASIAREDLRTASSGRGARALRGGLAATQVAFALVLLVGAGLLTASFRQAVAVQPGFVPQQVVTGSVALPAVRYKDGAARRAFADRALEQIRVVPGVARAATTDNIPFGNGGSNNVILAEGYVMKPGESLISGDNMTVSTEYFETMKIPLREGRFFDARDTADSQRVIIIDERLARKFFSGTSPLGRRMWRPNSPEGLKDPSKGADFFTIVGVVGAVRLRGLVDVDEGIGAYYFPFSQASGAFMTFAVKTETDPTVLKAGIRKVVNEVDPELPVYDVWTMQERIDNSLTSRRSPMVLSLCFSAVALFLAGVGIYGVLAYLVAQRTREIGIRVALGSEPGRIFALVFREGAGIIALGCVPGIACSWLLSRYMESVLYGVRPLDPVVIASVSLILLAVALTAASFPALRATRVNPIVALRQE
jgi:predicted permease